MTDLEIAKTELYEEHLTLVVVRDSRVLFQTKTRGIGGLLEAIEKVGCALEGASVADRVAGKAVALLCVYAKIKEVYAIVLSRKAQMVFKQNKINVQWREIVENVLDANKTGLCPFERAVAAISDPAEVYRKFKTLIENQKPHKNKYTNGL